MAKFPLKSLTCLPIFYIESHDACLFVLHAFQRDSQQRRAARHGLWRRAGPCEIQDAGTWEGKQINTVWSKASSKRLSG